MRESPCDNEAELKNKPQTVVWALHLIVKSLYNLKLLRNKTRETFCFSCPDLFEVLAESYPKAAIPVVEHLASHQRVEHSRAGQRDAKVEAEKPPVLCIPVELDVKTIT